MELLSVTGISKKEGDEYLLRDVGFRQRRFEKLAVAGETGSGKSTLLKIVAGLAQPAEGEVLFEGEKVRGPEEKLLPGHPCIAYLSQHFELRNSYRVEEELEYATRMPAEQSRHVYEVCRVAHLLKRWTSQLSGGERQRIALARLLVSSPRLLLLDEPFSNLDMSHRHILKSVIQDIGERLGITLILVSHEPADLLSWADNILVLKDGRMVQEGPPGQLYNQPRNEYVAGLFGSYNLITPAQAADFQNPGITLQPHNLLIRPENFIITTQKEATLKGIVRSLRFFGSHYEAEVRLPSSVITIRTSHDNIVPGSEIHLALASNSIWFLEDEDSR